MMWEITSLCIICMRKLDKKKTWWLFVCFHTQSLSMLQFSKMFVTRAKACFLFESFASNTCIHSSSFLKLVGEVLLNMLPSWLVFRIAFYYLMATSGIASFCINISSPLSSAYILKTNQQPSEPYLPLSFVFPPSLRITLSSLPYCGWRCSTHEVGS